MVDTRFTAIKQTRTYIEIVGQIVNLLRGGQIRPGEQLSYVCLTPSVRSGTQFERLFRAFHILRQNTFARDDSCRVELDIRADVAQTVAS